VETWETYESQTSPYFALMPSTFQSKNALEDNESYYWRVRIRHERYQTSAQMYDYGPWSPPMRFTLDSRLPGNPRLSTGGSADRTPTFLWDRVEGASGYTIQIDDDFNFSSPLISQKIAGTSYTPEEPNSFKALGDGTYYWRVAMRRSAQVMGRWTEPLSFDKRSPVPVPLSPIGDVVVAQQPTFQWTAVLTPSVTPRLAAPSYRLQVDDDPNFSGPKTYTTQATSYTLKKGQSLNDGTWYWRVAVLNANNQVGPYSAVQRFYKEYVPPVLLAPAQGVAVSTVPVFEWAPVDGAAYYKIHVADNDLFNGQSSATTDSTRHTPTSRVRSGSIYWRVRMYDADNKPGPFMVGRATLGSRSYLPLLPRR
jgi:hypothetical protein